MVRFKVIKASQLLMWLVIAVLAVILTVMLVRLYLTGETAPASSDTTGTSIVQTQDSNEAVAAFAAAASFDEGQSTGALFAQRDENEHLDEVVPPIIIERISPDESPSPAATTPPLPTASAAEDASGRSIAVQKRVLIYHTHTHEAYQKQVGDRYVETEEWRTADPDHSIVRVGRELKKELEARGIAVVHDTTDHEPPKLGTAYTRSLATLQKYSGQHFDCYIDLHRDAYTEGQGENVLALLNGNVPAAQLMMLIGNGEGFDVKPYFTENMAFAKQLTLALNAIRSGLCKDVLVKNGRYNQHIGWPAILVEVGNNKNTLQQSINAMPPLAEALASVLNGDMYLDAGMAVSAPGK